MKEDKTTFYAYNTIREFFDWFEYDGIIRETNTIIRAAAGHKIWKKEEPGYVVFNMEKLAELCSAAFVIHQSYSKREEVVIPAANAPDLSEMWWYYHGAYGCSAWDSLPRHLTGRQFFNPYKAIKKFCKYMPEAEWENTLETLTKYALFTDSILDTQPRYNILTMKLRLMQMIEACHLIQIRTTRKDKMEEDKKESQKLSKEIAQ